MFATIIVVLGITFFVMAILAARRQSRMSPGSREYLGEGEAPDARRSRRWSARSSAGFTDQGPNG